MSTLEQLVTTSAQVAATRGRNAKGECIADLLRTLEDEELPVAVCYLMGELPQGRVGVGYATLTGLLPLPCSPQSSLTIAEIHDGLTDVQMCHGEGVAEQRDLLLRTLLSRATEEEQRFLIRLLCGELRQGAARGLMLEAVGLAHDIDSALVRRATMLSGNVAKVAALARAGGSPALQAVRIELFRPLQPMLAQSERTAAGAAERLGECLVEYKMDGARVQIHKQQDEIRVYSRQLKEVTHAVPEIVEIVAALPAETLILDGETLGLDRNGRPLPFQTTMRRFGRRINVHRMREELPLSLFVFDCLHRDGEDLIDQPTHERVRHLTEICPSENVIPRASAASPQEAENMLAQALAAGHEGVMVKQTEAVYAAGRRGSGWLKVKQVHTLDLVVLAAEWGHGRRSGLLSNLHLGARDEKTGEYVILGKTFKGLTDALLRWQTDALQRLSVREAGNVVHVTPALVVEVAFNDIQRSPHYPAGMALRFARVKQYRPDKKAIDADTLATVRGLYQGD